MARSVRLLIHNRTKEMCIRDRLKVTGIGDNLLDDCSGKAGLVSFGTLAFRLTGTGQFPLRCTAVSYTHLDVYKRQVHDLSSHAGGAANTLAGSVTTTLTDI